MNNEANKVISEPVGQKVSGPAERAAAITNDILANHLPRVIEGLNVGYIDENQILVIYDHAVRARILKEESTRPPAPAVSTRYAKLSHILRERADAFQEKHESSPDWHEYSRDAELLRCLARMVEGKDVYRAFGAPGDWGYGTPIGDALKEGYNYQSPKSSTSHSEGGAQ